MKRPWGHIDRWIEGCGNERWDLVGTAGFEDRSISCLQLAKQNVHRALFLRLTPESDRARSRIMQKITDNSAAISAVFPDATYFDAGLLDAPLDFLEEIDRWAALGLKRVLVDMSAMPKRYLCILLKRLLEKKDIDEILVTYTIPEKYTEDPLAEDQAPIRSFQAFSKTELVDVPIKNIVMGLGYMPFDLRSVMDTIERQPKVNVLFPFPPGSPSFQRNWKLLLHLFGAGQDFAEPIRVDSRDASYAFDVIEDLTGGGKQTTLLLPFGPKPHSLAMILHSIYRNSEVRYTQPSYYNPEYSSGVRKIGQRDEVYAYAIRLEGKDLYA